MYKISHETSYPMMLKENPTLESLSTEKAETLLKERI